MSNKQRIILGIDPGSRILGFGVILVDAKKVHFIYMGIIDLRKEKEHFKKLKIILEKVSDLIDKYKPDDLSIEAPFYGKSIQAMITLGRAQGAAISAALLKNIPVYEYAPRKIKRAITGKGAASKEQVAMIISKTLNIECHNKYLDATDALAIAMCHFYQLTNPLLDTKTSTSWETFIKSHPGRIKK